MEKLIFKNARGKRIELSMTSQFIMRSIDGVSGVELGIQDSKSYRQDGRSYSDNTLDVRYIDVEFTIVANSVGEMAINRRRLIEALNPKLGLGELIYKFGDIERKIEALPESSPILTRMSGAKDLVQDGMITFYCPDPYFRDLAESKKEIAIWQSAFEFPLDIKPEGIRMGFREPSLIVNVFNGGDVKTGMRIRFKATGTLVNPSLFNVNTREYFKINTTMLPGDVITVNTNTFNKGVELERNGVVCNYFNWMDLRSTFLQLDIGDNLFRYDADEDIDNLEVDIYYNPRSLGV